MRKILLFLLIIGTFSTVFAQTTVHVKVTVTNSADLQNPKVNEIVSKVKLQDLKTAMEANYSLQNRENLTVHLAFYDKTYIGSLNLKNDNPLVEDQYVTHWKSNHPTGNHILFLFVKGKDKADFEYNTLEVSPEMEDRHLFTEVMNFIRANLSGSPTQRVEKGTKYLANAIRPVWDSREREPNKKKDQAVNLANQAKYKSNRINLFHGNFSYSYLNFRPATATQTQGLMAVGAFSLPKNHENIDTANLFISNKYIFTSDTEMQGFNVNDIYKWDVSFELDAIAGVYFFYGPYIYNLLRHLEDSEKHHTTIRASEWQWSKPSRFTREISSFEGFKDRDSTDRLIMFCDQSSNSQEGQYIPILSTSHGNTWCNVYASDLSRSILFPELFSSGRPNEDTYAPWGKHAWANHLHYRIFKNANGVFHRLNFENDDYSNPSGKSAWDYVEAGYVVYFTSFGKDMNEDTNFSKDSESKVPTSPSGHIATGFNHQSRTFIHVGGQAYDNNPEAEWSGAKKAHVYLGFIKKDK